MLIAKSDYILLMIRCDHVITATWHLRIICFTYIIWGFSVKSCEWAFSLYTHGPILSGVLRLLQSINVLTKTETLSLRMNHAEGKRKGVWNNKGFSNRSQVSDLFVFISVCSGGRTCEFYIMNVDTVRLKYYIILFY